MNVEVFYALIEGAKVTVVYESAIYREDIRGICYSLQLEPKILRRFKKLFEPLYLDEYSAWFMTNDVYGGFVSNEQALEDRLLALDFFREICISEEYYKEF